MGDAKYGMVQFWDDAWAGNYETMAVQVPLVPHYLACFNKRQPKCSNATMLHVAAQCGHVKVVQLMVENGADVNIQDDDGKTPLFVAASFNNVDVVKILVRVQGVQIDKATTEGRSALQIAADLGHAKVAKILVDAGADVDAKGANNATALHEAAVSGNEAIVRILLSRGADMEARDWKHKYTPLHRAIVAGRSKIVKLLLAHGANIEARDGGHLTPLHMACAGSHSSVLAPVLLKVGADPNALTKDGRTALDVGLHSGITRDTKACLEEHGGQLKNLEIIRNVILNPGKAAGTKRKLGHSDDDLDSLDDDDGDFYSTEYLQDTHAFHLPQDEAVEAKVVAKVVVKAEAKGDDGPSIKSRGPRSDFVCCQKSSACSNQNGHRGRCNANLLASTPVS